MSSKSGSKSSITPSGGKKTSSSPTKTSPQTSTPPTSTTTPIPASPRGGTASAIKSKSSITFSSTTTSPSSPNLSSTISSSPPQRITSSVSSSSFQYWKEKETTSPPSQSPATASPKLTPNNPTTATTTTTSNSTKTTSSSTTNSSVTNSSPVKKSIFSLGKKSSPLSSSPPTSSPTISSQPPPATISAGSSINKVSFKDSSNNNTTGGENNTNVINNSNLNNPQLGSSTLPNRMNNRKSLKNPLNIFSLDFWSNKNEDSTMGNNTDESLKNTTQQEQSNDSQKTNNVTTPTVNNSNNSNNIKTPPTNSPNLTSTTSKSKSTIGISTPSNNNPTAASTPSSNNSGVKKSFISNSNSTPPSNNTTPSNTSPVTQSSAIPIRQPNTNLGSTTTTPSPTKLSSANKSNSLSSAGPRKNSSATTTTTASSTPTTTSVVKPNLMAPKKVSPSLQPTSSTTTSNNISLSDDTSSESTPHNTPPLSSSGSGLPTTTSILGTSVDSNLPFDPEEMVNLSRLKSKISKSDFERLVNLEFYTRVLAKDLEDVTSKLVNETSMRKDLESHTKELEARLRISEARFKRYSTMPQHSDTEGSTLVDDLLSSPLTLSPKTSTPPPPVPPRSYLSLIQAEKDQLEIEESELSRVREEREDQRINSLLIRMEQLEKKVNSLEQRNSQLLEEIHHLQTENQLLNPDRKKTLKKLEKEKEKELQKEQERLQREKEKELQKEKEKEKQRQKDLLKLQNRDRKQSVSASSAPQIHNNYESTNSSSAPEMDNFNNDTDSNDTNSEVEVVSGKSNLKRKENPSSSSLTSANDLLSSPQKKNVVFNDGKSSVKSSSYLSSVTLRKNTAKRMSAHYASTTSSQFNDTDDGNNSTSTIGDDQSTTSEKVKAIFHDIYDGNIEEMKNQKLTRMRSKSLSKDPSSSGSNDIDEDVYNSQPSSAAKLNFSNSASTITASLSLTKDNIPISLCTSVDTNNISVTPANQTSTPTPTIITIPTPSNVPTSKPDAMEKIRHLTLGRMSSKKKPGYKDAQLQLSEKLNHRASKNELIFKNIIKAESIFGIALAEDTSDRLMDYLNKSIDYLLDHSVIEGLFSIEIEDSKLKLTIEHIEGTLITDFSLITDPCLVASTFIYYFSKLPNLLLSKIAPQLIHSVEIGHIEYRKNVIRSLLYSLPLQNRNILKIILQFLKKFNQACTTNNGGSIDVPQEDPESNAAYIRFTKAFMPTTPGNLELSTKSVKFMAMDIDEFDSLPQDIQYMVKDGESIVKAASFDRLIEKLFDLSYSFKDPDYNYTIFHTYDYYTTSCDLLEKFVYYYHIACTLSPRLQMEVSITILSVAMFWMKIHHNHLMTDLAFLQKLKTFIDSIPQIPTTQNTYFSYFSTFFKPTLEPLKPLYERGNSFLGPNLTQSSGTSKKKNQLIEKMMINNANGAGGNLNGNNTVGSNSSISIIKSNPNCDVDIYSIGAGILAQQITVIDNEMLMAIPPSQFLHKSFTKYQSSPQFHDMVAKFNEWARWTSSEILSKEKLVERVVCLAFFIDLAKNCVELGNYNAANAIVGGLNHSSISRLKLTWERLSTKISQDYDRLESLFDLSMNYKNYREEIKSTKAKIIPYLGLFPKDLIAIEEGNDNFTSTNLINTEKFRLLYGTIKKIQSYQQPLFNIKSNEPIKNYLRNISSTTLLEEKDFHNLSIKLEPRQTTSN